MIIIVDLTEISIHKQSLRIRSIINNSDKGSGNTLCQVVKEYVKIKSPRDQSCIGLGY